MSSQESVQPNTYPVNGLFGTQWVQFLLVLAQWGTGDKHISFSPHEHWNTPTASASDGVLMADVWLKSFGGEFLELRGAVWRG